MKEKVINTIRVERAIHRLTQADLALMADISRQAIHNIEAYKMMPSIKICLKLIRCLNNLKAKAGTDTVNIEDIFKLEKL